MIIDFCWAVVVTRLAVWSLPTQEIRGSNPIIGTFYCNNHYVYCTYRLRSQKYV